MLSIIYFLIAGICITYDIVLIITSPGTFLDNLTSFTHIWSLLGFLFIFFGMYRIKKGHSIWKDCKKWLKILILSIVGFGLTVTIGCFILIFTPKIATETDKLNCDYVILLGGGIDDNGQLPENVQNRIKLAGNYMKENKKVFCIVTGGKLKWHNYAEAPEMKRALVNEGIDSERILIEDQALDTIQNLQNSCKLLAEHENKSESEILNSNVIIITNHFHLKRAEILANRLGYKNVTGLQAKCNALRIPHLYVREIAAYVKLGLRILFTGQPCSLVSCK